MITYSTNPFSNVFVWSPLYFMARLFEEINQELARQADAAAARFKVPQEFRKFEMTRVVSPEAVGRVTKLMGCVRPGSEPEEYIGADMNLLRAWLFAKASTDWNKIHLRFSQASEIGDYQLIAQGWDVVIQAVAAMYLYLEGAGLVPERVIVEFRKPVKLGKGYLVFVMDDGDPTFQKITVFTQDELRVANITITLREGVSPMDELAARLLLGCYASAAHAEFNPGCAFYQDDFGLDESAVPYGPKKIRLQGLGMERNKILNVDVRVVDDNPDLPLLRGWEVTRGRAKVVPKRQ
ncbi:MAG TPA: hypothetical protein PL001_05140 [Candidatus Kryptobacter bacterium]|nr:MAG: hypothetical protein B7X03_03265 [Parcubacteria group bacterium 21-58-10]HQT91396.1 hypothetical protein [Candidatus Kryptobacter bacterium]